MNTIEIVAIMLAFVVGFAFACYLARAEKVDNPEPHHAADRYYYSTYVRGTKRALFTEEAVTEAEARAQRLSHRL